ncbi:MAG: outer membrane beta-barrel protein, partial [Opitutaceae bacterium]|nr:outer membrane beta-barrel protein [Verrucomicrobiales bacterium]
LTHVPFIFNVVFRCDRTNSNWLPYIGAGAGCDASIINLDHTITPVPGVTVDGTDVSMVFAWQAFAGVRYRIDPNMSIGAGYKYYQAQGGSWDVQYSGSNSIQFGQARVHGILVEFNMKF